MSAKQRTEGEALRQKYARTFGLPIDDVIAEFFEGEEVQVYYRVERVDHPVWTIGADQKGSVER